MPRTVGDELPMRSALHTLTFISLPSSKSPPLSPPTTYLWRPGGCKVKFASKCRMEICQGRLHQVPKWEDGLYYPKASGAWRVWRSSYGVERIPTKTSRYEMHKVRRHDCGSTNGDVQTNVRRGSHYDGASTPPEHYFLPFRQSFWKRVLGDSGFD